MLQISDIKRELIITSEKLVQIVEEQGIYFAIAFLHDSNYDPERIKKLLPVLEKTRGSIIKEKNE